MKKWILIIVRVLSVAVAVTGLVRGDAYGIALGALGLTITSPCEWR